jgi:hypothetical protein
MNGLKKEGNPVMCYNMDKTILSEISQSQKKK